MINEQIEKAKEKSLQNFADNIVQELIQDLFQELDNFGIDTDTDSFTKDFSFAVDALKATVFRSVGLSHPLHDFIDTNVKISVNVKDLSPVDLEKLDKIAESIVASLKENEAAE